MIRRFKTHWEGSAHHGVGARISAAYCLGLITLQQRNNLRKIKQIRNHFAHNLHGNWFEEEPVRGWCAQLAIDEIDPDLADVPRDQFAKACHDIEADLEYSEKLQPSERRQIRKLAVWEWMEQEEAKRPPAAASSAG